jgi:transposase
VIHSLLLPVADLAIESISQQEKVLELTLTSAAITALCPHCQQAPTKIHSRYCRTMADLPWSDFQVKLRLWVRRFFCQNPHCTRKTFAQRFAFLVPYARQTTRLRNNLCRLALTTSAQCGSRLATLLAMPSSSSTMLRLMHGYQLERAPVPTKVGIDDFAWRKGQRYGTIIVDLEKQQVVDLLPDRESGTVSKWLIQQPGVRLITRAAAYGEAATVGAPEATQVADRFHLLVNLTNTLQTFFDRQARALQKAAFDLAQAPSETPPSTGEVNIQSSGYQGTTQPHALKAKEVVFTQIKALHAQGYAIRRIAQQLSVSRERVNRYLAHESLPAYAPRVAGTKFSPFTDLIHTHWSSGAYNRKQLFELIRQNGYCGSYGNLCKYLKASFDPSVDNNQPRVRPISARKAAFLLSRPADDLSAKQTAELAAILTHCAPAVTIHPLVTDFALMIRKRLSEKLDAWLQRVEVCPVTCLQGLAGSIRRDYSAVKAALSCAYSNGPVEGQVNRLKLIKRQCYGRAGFNLLRKRVLCKI